MCKHIDCVDMFIIMYHLIMIVLLQMCTKKSLQSRFKPSNLNKYVNALL